MTSRLLDPDLDDNSRRILDAVREEVLTHGLRKATMTSIANRAGVSRVTLYRRGNDLQTLIMEAIVREFKEIFGQFIAKQNPGNGRDTVVQICIGAVLSLSRAPLFCSIKRTDPEMFLPYLVERIGRSQQMMLAAMEPVILRGIRDQSIRPQNPKILALMLLQTLTSFGLSVHLVTQIIDEATLRKELTILVGRYLDGKIR